MTHIWIGQYRLIQDITTKNMDVYNVSPTRIGGWVRLIHIGGMSSSVANGGNIHQLQGTCISDEPAIIGASNTSLEPTIVISISLADLTIDDEYCKGSHPQFGFSMSCLLPGSVPCFDESLLNRSSQCLWETAVGMTGGCGSLWHCSKPQPLALRKLTVIRCA